MTVLKLIFLKGGEYFRGEIQ